MYRKVFIICIWVFMTGVETSVQALSLIVVLICALYLQYEYKPYNKHQLNHMEMEAIFTSAITIYCGMFYLTESIGNEFKTILFLVIVLGNVYFMFYWFYFMFQAVIDFLVNYFPWCKRLQGKMNPFPDHINTDVVVREGVFKDKEAGILTYTILPKKLIKENGVVLHRVNNINDVYIQTMESIAEKKNCVQALSEKNDNQNFSDENPENHLNSLDESIEYL